MTQEQQNKLDSIVNDLAADFKPMVQEIESGIATTQHNYGRYGGIISKLSGGKPATAKIIALALIKAGANAMGVNNGLNLLVLGTGPVGWTEA